LDSSSLSFDPVYGFMAGGGAMGALMRGLDWSKTSFGPVEDWSQALKSAVTICLGSRFPMVLYWGPERALIYNDAWSPVLGQKHPWALGRPGWEVWSEIWDIIGPMFDQVMEQGEATWSADQLLPLNRFGYVEECYFYYSYSPVRGGEGRVEGVFTAVAETTSRVLTERRERLLRELSERALETRTVEEALAAAVAVLSATPEEAPFCVAYQLAEGGRLLRRLAMGGTDPGAALCPGSIPVGEPEASLLPVRDAIATGLPAVLDGLASRHGFALPGTPWPEPVEQVLVVPVLSPRSSEPHGLLVAGISPRRRLDDAYRTLFERAAAHVSTSILNAEAYAAERRRAEELAELDRAKTAFFSNASHEFRTPLTLMLGPVEDMLGAAPDAERLEVGRSELDLVHRNGLRLLKLVNTLLDFSRIEAGRVHAQVQPLDLASLTAELASTFRSAMQRAGLEYQVTCAPLPEPVWVDREMWEKVVLNLISNAFKYTLAGGVAVRLEVAGDAALLSVADTGTGIPPAELPRIFERFHRIEGQRGRTYEGTGIGLSLVQELVHLHGGTVQVDSAEGRGSTFTVRLPFGRAHVAPA